MGDAFCRVNLSDSKEGWELLRGFLEEDGCLEIIGGLFSLKDIIDPNPDAVRFVSWERIIELLDRAGAFLAHGTKIEIGNDIQSVIDFIDADIRRFIGHGLEILIVSFVRHEGGDDENGDARKSQEEKGYSQNERPIKASEPISNVLEEICHD